MQGYWGTYIAYELEAEDGLTLLEDVKRATLAWNVPLSFHAPGYLHLTILYTGWLTRSQALSVKQITNRLTGLYPVPAIELTSRLMYLPFDKESAYLALEIAPNPGLSSLRRALEAELAGLTGAAPQHPFLPHISAARLPIAYAAEALPSIPLTKSTITYTPVRLLCSASTGTIIE